MPSSQQTFLAWAESKNERWPEIKKGRFAVALLDEAIQEGVAHYLKKKDVAPLRQFLESAAKLVSPSVCEKILPPSLAHKGLPPSEANRAKVLKELCDFYGFAAEFELGWRTCVESGFDCEESNYMTFAVRCRERKFNARQAYYFPSLRPPLTDVGRRQKVEIFPLVDEDLSAFEAQEGKNIFDFYLDIAEAVSACCLNVEGLECFSKPKGRDVFEQGRFQDRILAEFRRQFSAGLKPFEDRLRTVFDDPEEFARASEQAFARFKTDLLYPLRQKREFFHRHFYEVCTAGDKFGLRVNIYTLDKVYHDGQHQVALPFFPALLRECMGQHIAKIFRGCEDRFRQSLGLRGVGQGWVSEATLFASIKQAFPQEIVLHHAKPQWIGRQHLDIYFPRLNLAVEYQGVQHGRSVAIFGGEAGLRVRKRLDKKKKELCESNGCLLIEVFPDDPIEPIVEQIRTRMGQVAEVAGISMQSSTLLPRKSPHSNIANKSIPTPAPDSPVPKRRASENWKKHLGKDDLPACARHGDRELILQLAGERAGLKTFRNGEKETLLFIAAKEGNIETATALLDVGLDPNTRDWRKASILSKICNRWRVRPKPEIVRLLLERGANPALYGTLTPAIFDRCGYALPINGCAMDGYLDCARVLFEWTKSINQQQPYSLLTPIMCACHRFDRHQHEHRSLDMIRWLIETGADLGMRSRLGFTPMDFALGTSWYQPMSADSIKAGDISSVNILELLFRSGARPSESFKPLFEVAMNRKTTGNLQATKSK